MTKQVATRDLFDLILKPITTEKAVLLLEQNKFVFDVVPKATKPQIKAAIEGLFNVKVTRVNTAHRPIKKRRVGKSLGYKAHYKRATITLQEGDSITLFPDV
jgi:large subunit ribosomal protein L23